MIPKLQVGDIVLIDVPWVEMPTEIINTFSPFHEDSEHYRTGFIYEFNFFKTEVLIFFHLALDFHVFKWYKVSNIKSLIREYKILNLVEISDRNTSRISLVCDLSSINRSFQKKSTETKWVNTFSINKFDIFIFPINCGLANSMLRNPEESCFILFNWIKTGHANLNGVDKAVFYPTCLDIITDNQILVNRAYLLNRFKKNGSTCMEMFPE